MEGKLRGGLKMTSFAIGLMIIPFATETRGKSLPE
jgi:hypothetical protein